MLRCFHKTTVGVIALAALAGCNRTPSGQVAANVDGDEITVSELRLEMQGAAASVADQRAALQQLIARKLLFKEAERQKLTDSPAAKAARAGAEETSLVELLQAKLMRDATVDDSQAAIDRFISEHPSQFSDRRLISAEQLIIPGGNANLLAQVNGIKTMPGVEALLTQSNLPYIKTQSVIDTAAMPPALAARVVALGADQVFVSPAANGSIQVTRVLSSRTQPLAGDAARSAARNLLEQTRTDAARTRMRAIVQQGQKNVWVDPSLGKT